MLERICGGRLVQPLAEGQPALECDHLLRVVTEINSKHVYVTGYKKIERSTDELLLK